VLSAITGWQSLCYTTGVLRIAGSLTDTSMGRVHALFSRIHLLEQHAQNLQVAFHNPSMKADTRAVISTLHQAEAWLNATSDPTIIGLVEDLVSSASQQLSGLGRAT
jgi:hypothetical protein